MILLHEYCFFLQTWEEHGLLPMSLCLTNNLLMLDGFNRFLITAQPPVLSLTLHTFLLLWQCLWCLLEHAYIALCITISPVESNHSFSWACVYVTRVGIFAVLLSWFLFSIENSLLYSEKKSRTQDKWFVWIESYSSKIKAIFLLPHPSVISY